MRAPYIAVEGIDGAGTTTLSLALSSKLNMFRIVEPPTSKIGILIRDILKGIVHVDPSVRDEVLTHLFVAARYRLQPLIKEQTDGPNGVISDRCMLSTYVYQWSMGHAFLDAIHRDIVKPDLLVRVRCDPKLAHHRLHGRPHLEMFDGKELLQLHAARYGSLYGRETIAKRWFTVEADMPTAEQVEKITDFVKNNLTPLP
jgi:dTMP kinase